MVTNEGGLGGMEFVVTDDFLAVSVFIGCGNKDGRIFTAMQPFLLKRILSTLSQISNMAD